MAKVREVSLHWYVVSYHLAKARKISRVRQPCKNAAHISLVVCIHKAL